MKTIFFFVLFLSITQYSHSFSISDIYDGILGFIKGISTDELCEQQAHTQCAVAMFKRKNNILNDCEPDIDLQSLLVKIMADNIVLDA